MGSHTNDGVLLRWTEQPERGFKDVDGGRIVLFDQSAWAAAEERLESGAGASYVKLARAGDFGPWWLGECGDSTYIRRFRLQLPPPIWERPWEGLVGGIDPPRWNKVSIIRQIEGEVRPPQPIQLTEPLRVLCLQGASSGPGLDPLDLAAEFAAMEKAHASLDLAAREAIAAPRAVGASLDTLAMVLREHHPTVIWFSGHGRTNPAGVLLADNHWLTPDELAAQIERAAGEGGRTPLYVILWACQRVLPGVSRPADRRPNSCRPCTDWGSRQCLPRKRLSATRPLC